MFDNIKEKIADNLAVYCFLGFFAALGLFRLGLDMTYKETLPVSFSQEFTAAECKQLRRSLDITLKTWQADFHQHSRWVRVRIVRDIPGTKVGEYNSGKDEIVLEAGAYNELPAFYHELCHLNLTSGAGEGINSANHVADGWVYWNHRCRDVALMIAQQRHGVSRVNPDAIPSIYPFDAPVIKNQNGPLTIVTAVIK